MTDNTFDFFCSWSGGKDSCLALHRMTRGLNRCRFLFTMINIDGKHSKSHHLTMEALKAQADALGCELHIGKAEWNSYENEFIDNLKSFNEKKIHNGVFGDIDLQPHREWVERVCAEAGITAHEPLWQGNRRELVEECVKTGIQSRIVVVNTKLIPEPFLGREIDLELLGELESEGIDGCGENGEYHSYVYNAPLFSGKIRMVDRNVHHHDGYAFLDFAIG
jgi:diphthine-ammonia ligase